MISYDFPESFDEKYSKQFLFRDWFLLLPSPRVTIESSSKKSLGNEILIPKFPSRL